MHEEHINRLLGKRLRRRRRLLGMSQQALGEACGVSFQQIQKYEAAVNRITAAKLWELSRALGVEVSYFYEGISLPAVVEPRVLEREAEKAVFSL